MRKHKYRGQTKDGKEVKGYLVILLNGSHIIVSEASATSEDDSCPAGGVSLFFVSDHWDEVIPESVGEFTGKQDSKGRDVYENAIAQHPHGQKYIVKWNVKQAGFYLESLDENSPNQDMSYVEVCEVIGHAHEGK